MSSPLRLRLTLWYVGAFSVVLILFSTGVYFFVARILVGRMNANLRVTLHTTRSVLARNANQSMVAEALEDPRFPGQIVALVNADGQVLARKPIRSAVAFRLPALPLRASPSPQFYELQESNSEADDSCRGVYQQLTPGAGGGSSTFVVVSASAETIGDQMDALETGLEAAIVLALLVSGSGGWLLARRSLSPLADMAAATERITANNLGERLPVGASDELGRLASKFNELLSRLSASFSQQRQFMADASHELRTPLSVVRTAAQVALHKPQRSDSEYREALAVIEQQAGRLSRIVEDMFALTRADMNQLPLNMGDLYLDEIVADTTRAAGILAQRKSIRIRSQSTGEAPYRGDDRLLRQMISNLLDNAVKFTREAGTIDVRLRQTGVIYEITVADTGCGIPDELQPRVFDRFFRVDTARSGPNGLGGAGLGLAIARAIAELHGGRLTLQHSGSAGSTFLISLPCRE
ncbi:MAG TPA: ATP-binding protein [Terriglobales bacterium]|jgi:two-component system OmpR family sensor kinase|nr:ATP-binding protein [Terriglobales bacterium]